MVQAATSRSQKKGSHHMLANLNRNYVEIRKSQKSILKKD